MSTRPYPIYLPTFYSLFQAGSLLSRVGGWYYSGLRLVSVQLALDCQLELSLAILIQHLRWLLLYLMVVLMACVWFDQYNHINPILILPWASVLQVALFRHQLATTLVATISGIIFFWHEWSTLQSVVSGPLFSPLFSIFSPPFSVATFSNKSARIKKRI